MSESAFLRSVAQAFSDALAPLRLAVEGEEEFSQLLAEHGWEASPDAFDVAQLQSLFPVRGDFIDFAGLIQQADAADSASAVQLILDAVDKLKAVVTKVRALANLAADPQLPFPFDRSDFWQEFPGELVQALFARYLEAHQPSVSSPLLMLGILGRETVAPAGPGRIEYQRATIHWDRIGDLLQPKVLIDEVFFSQAGEFLARRLIDSLGLAALVDGIRGALLAPDDGLLDAYYSPGNPARDDVRMLLLPLLGGAEAAGAAFGLGLTVLPIPPVSDPGAAPVGVALGPAVSGMPQQLDLGPVEVTLTGGFQDDRGLQLELRPGQIRVAPSLADGVFAQLEVAHRRSQPMVLIGTRDGHRLQADRFGLGLRCEGTPAGGVDVRFDLALDGVQMVFDTAGGDAFTREVAGTGEQRLGFDAGLSWSSRHGLTWRGQIGLDAHLPVHARVGPLAVDALRLGLTAPDGALALAAGISGSGRLGPLTVIVQDLGLELEIASRGDGSEPGNFGVFDVDWSVRWPSGYGLELRVSSDVRGGGFLTRDAAADRWIGALDLEIRRFRFTGLGITDGDSVIGLLWFQGLKIPLFGGLVTGLGALLAHRRRGDRDAFVGALRSGALESLMFPADPMAQAPVLAANLVRLFPYDAERTVAGLLARWVFGEEAELVVVDLGLLVEFSGAGLHKIVVLGRGRARIKDLSEDVFRINVELYGEWDLGRGELLVLASLRDSRLLGGELSGDGMLYSGPLAGFILTVGGFNPRYSAPAGLPALRRLSARLIDRDNVKLGVELYFALTTCNVQFGVKAALWAGAGGFAITGDFGLDALMRFDFSMVVDLAFAVTLRRGSKVLASIGFEGVLEGVSPLRLDGKARLKVLFLSVSVPVSVQIGDSGAVTQPEVDALEPLRQAMAAAENWTSAGAGGAVLAERDRAGIWAAPEGALRMSQQVVPLDLELTRLGPSPLRTPQQFAIASVELAGPRTTRPVESEFSLGLYQDLDLDESIRAPLTESLESGFELAADSAQAGVGVASDADYEEIVVDAPVAAGAASDPQMLVRQVALGRRTPRPGLEPEETFYRSEASPVKLGAPRFLTVDDALVPDPAQGAETLARGMTYAKARQFRAAVAGPTSVRIVRRHEAFVQ